MDPSYQTENLGTCSQLRKALEEDDKLIVTADSFAQLKTHSIDSVVTV
jgi:hypothetical protein